MNAELLTIGIDATRANDPHKTGVGWYAWHVIQEMKALQTEQDIQFVLYSARALQGELATLPSNWSSKVLGWPPKRLWTQVRLSWEMLVHKPDVLFIPGHVAPLICPKNTYTTVHDVAAAHFPKSYSWFERWYSLWSADRAMRSLRGVFVPSQAVKNDLINRNGSYREQKIHVTPLACDVPEQLPSGVAEQYGIHTPFFMSVSRLEEKKNTKRIVQAFDAFCATSEEQYSLVLIGNPGHGYAAVAHAIDQSPNKSRIILPNSVHKDGWIPMGDVYALMAEATAFVFPSLYEGFGIPILEAFSCNTPVITSHAGSLPEVGGEACVYVDPQDVDAIADGMKKVVEDVSYAQHMQEKGKERVKAFSWQRCARQTYEVLCGS